MVSREATPYPQLNKMLARLVREISGQLGGNFVGAYLQGSFALGDFTESSDADVLIVIECDLPGVGISALQALHQDLFTTLPNPWGQRIELSYAPAAILRRLTDRPRDPVDDPRPTDWVDPATGEAPRSYPFWYLNNGSDRLVRSEHDNTNVVRWVTREHGITLAGPDPKLLIDPVRRADLEREAGDLLRLVSLKWTSADVLESRMLQTFFVTLCVRALHTLETGSVTSKKAATEWAVSHLDPDWRPLIESAWAAWRGPRDALHDLADIGDIERTIAFMHYAWERAESLNRTRSGRPRLP